MKSENVRLIVDARDFDKAFEDNMAKYHTYKAAYEATEKEHEKLTGRRRYSDHHSYEVSRSRRMNRRRKRR